MNKLNIITLIWRISQCWNSFITLHVTSRNSSTGMHSMGSVHVCMKMIVVSYMQAMIYMNSSTYSIAAYTISVVPHPNVAMTPMVSPGLSTAMPMRMSPAMVASPVKPVSPVVPCTPGTPGIVTPVSPAAIGMVASPQQPTGKLQCCLKGNFGQLHKWVTFGVIKIFAEEAIGTACFRDV